MVLPLLKRDRNPLDQKLKNIENQSNLIENSIKRLERNMRRNTRQGERAPVPTEPQQDAFRADSVRHDVSTRRHHPAEKLSKYLATGSFQAAGTREVPARVRRNRRLFFTVLGIMLLILLFWFLMS
ncbi:MAG: hypothetical protein PHP44_07635 [Kiritimatiellae bacterium]|nr:hypothetical protein [Kiritimatiellia bacterium]MDD4735961.1 hypothetical protein [Kiritimatiellia bacterium]